MSTYGDISISQIETCLYCKRPLGKLIWVCVSSLQLANANLQEELSYFRPTNDNEVWLIVLNVHVQCTSHFKSVFL